jgi:hypothetical protein
MATQSMSALFLLDGLLCRLGRELFYGLSFGSAILGLLLPGTGRELLRLQIGGAFLGIGFGMLGIANRVRLAAVSEKLGAGPSRALPRYPALSGACSVSRPGASRASGFLFNTCSWGL